MFLLHVSERSKGGLTQRSQLAARLQESCMFKGVMLASQESADFSGGCLGGRRCLCCAHTGATTLLVPDAPLDAGSTAWLLAACLLGPGRWLGTCAGDYTVVCGSISSFIPSREKIFGSVCDKPILACRPGRWASMLLTA